MANIISFDVNNGGKMKLIQREHDGSCLISTEDEKGLNNSLLSDKEAFISNGDMVMLLNYYAYVKRNDIQNDFINPNGKNHEGNEPCTNN